jgi:hypothetical protein
MRRRALGVLGYWFDRENGRSPGRMALLRASPRDLRRMTGEKYLSDLLAILALRPDMPVKDILQLSEAQGDIAGALSGKTWGLFAEIWKRDQLIYEPLILGEERAAVELKARLEPDMEKSLKDEDPEVVQSALIALGQWNEPGAPEILRPFVDSDRALWREAAATALAKTGPQARPALSALWRSPWPRTRCLAVAAAAQSWDAWRKKLIRKALKDPEETVRRAARGAVSY